MDAAGERRGRREAGRGVRPRANGEWVAVARAPDEKFVRKARGAELVGWRYAGPFDELDARPGSSIA